MGMELVQAHLEAGAIQLPPQGLLRGEPARLPVPVDPHVRPVEGEPLPFPDGAGALDAEGEVADIVPGGAMSLRPPVLRSLRGSLIRLPLRSPGLRPKEQ